jgi:hypothetical protein
MSVPLVPHAILAAVVDVPVDLVIIEPITAQPDLEILLIHQRRAVAGPEDLEVAVANAENVRARGE